MFLLSLVTVIAIKVWTQKNAKKNVLWLKFSAQLQGYKLYIQFIEQNY